MVSTILTSELQAPQHTNSTRGTEEKETGMDLDLLLLSGEWNASDPNELPWLWTTEVPILPGREEDSQGVRI